MINQEQEILNNRKFRESEVFDALGLQLQTQRSLARFVEQKHRQDEWDLAVDYYVDEGYSQSYAEELAEQQLGYGNPENDEVL